MSDSLQATAVRAMGQQTSGFDVTIICTTDDHQAQYWMEILEDGMLSGHKVLAVSEDWGPGGAGNGLGTLYAFEKASALAKTKYDGFDLQAELDKKSISAALYHTAGKGTRMAPLPASENNNKPGVKLPFRVKSGETYQSISVLESVIRQTGIYAKARKGRVSVFWGDQVFLPTAPFDSAPTHHVDILCTLLGDTAPTAQEWEAQGLDKYGVIAVVESGGSVPEAAQVEKVSHETATNMLGSLGTIRQVGPSLGSFSVSSQFMSSICKEFAVELSQKTAKLDTDPHFWMPLTLPQESYVQLMKQKGVDEDTSRLHFDRMKAFKTSFLDSNKDLGLFGAVDVGKDACWWDYGQLKLYSTNCRLLLEKSPEADLLREFLGLDDARKIDSTLGGGTVDDTSYVLSSKLSQGTITESLISNVASPTIDAKGAIVVNTASPKSIQAGAGAIVYNVISDEAIVVGDGEVVVGVTDETGTSFLLKSRMDIDGGKAWKQVLEMNELSFEAVMNKNKNANITEISKQRQSKFDAIASSF